MSYVESHDVTIAVDASGDGTGYTPVITGKIVNIIYTKDDYADGVDFVITLENSGIGLWTDANVNASETVAPSQLNSMQTGAAETDPTAVPIYCANDRVKIVVDEGGVSKSGTFTVIVA